MKKLTPKQRLILRWIRTHSASHGYPPTRAEICRHFGFASPNSAQEHLMALERRGAIKISARVARGITIL